ncbi:MAG: glycosyltransferase family 39 protein [bacterium]|nr:glycosyltransferase family 39 protein [bacterium]
MTTHEPSESTRRPAAAFAPARLAAHAVSFILFATGLLFLLWDVQTNPPLWGIFGHLLEPWRLGGGAMDWAGLVWGVGGVAVFALIGWFYLEGLELYLPRAARAALAYIFGLGLAGFVLECLAIPHWLSRASVGLGLAGLPMLLGARAWLAARRAPESGLGGEAGAAESMLRRALARQAWRQSLERPAGPGGRLFKWLALLLLGAITLATFWHALLYPEVYWDSLILYLGYARMTFLEGGFPVKVTGQVGIGLGANYPHLYAVLGAGVATAAGAWSELPQRLMAPLAGLASTVLVYHTALRLVRRTNFALAVALLYRSVPLGIIYDIYGSDYALVVLFSAAFLYLALCAIDTALSGWLAALTMLVALAMHLNYLMGLFWLPWALTFVAAHAGWPREGARLRGVGSPPPAAWTRLEPRPGLGKVLGRPRFWLMLAACVAIGSTWYIRNWIVTGNPVYAFFYKILDGRCINPEVMAAAEKEWMANGSGIGSLDAFFSSRLRAAWAYFVTWKNAWETAPLLPGFAAWGLVLWAAVALAALAGRGAAVADPLARRRLRAGRRWGFVVAVLGAALLAFHFVLAPFYLYQIIAILPCAALLVAFDWPWWQPRPWRWALGALVLAVGVFPGLAFGLMGFKITSAFELPGGRIETPWSLYILRHPLPDTQRFYRWRFGADPIMWEYVNRELKGQRLLTHENRDLVFDPSITLINLDDWNMQQLWKIKDPTERVRLLIQKYYINYYLFVPNELATPTNQRMGAADWPRLGLAELIFQAGDNKLYRLKPPAAPMPAPTPTPVPADAAALAPAPVSSPSAGR